MTSQSQANEGDTPSKQKIPNYKDKVRLKLIYITGKTHEFYFTHDDSAADIGKYVYENWPEEWAEDRVDNHRILRLIYQGRFLHGNVTLGAIRLPLGKLTVMHLVPRENLPEVNSQGESNREKSEERSCIRCCNIL